MVNFKYSKNIKVYNTVAKNTYGVSFSKLPLNKRVHVRRIAKNPVAKQSDTTNIPGTTKRFFTGSESSAAKYRRKVTRKVGLELKYYGHSWKRDGLGRLYLGFNGTSKNKNVTVKLDKTWFFPKK